MDFGSSAALIAPAQLWRHGAIRLEYLAIAWNLLEAIVAIVAGALTGTIAFARFGLASALETISGATLLGRLRQRGNSEARAESLALRIVGITFFLLAGYIVYELWSDLRAGSTAQESRVGIVLAAVSLVVMSLLGRAKRRVAWAAVPLPSMGWRPTCSYLSLALLLGLGLSAWLGCWWADPLAALAMVSLMPYEGWEAFRGQRC